MNHESKAHLNSFIQYQADWIRSLQTSQEQLEKYRDGILPFDDQRIAELAEAQDQLARAVRTMAQTIAASAREV